MFNLDFNLHLHSHYSLDAERENTILNIANEAKIYGFQTIAITDHEIFFNKEETLKNILNEIKKVEEKINIKIIPGIEVSIENKKINWFSHFDNYNLLVIAGYHHSPPRPTNKQEYFEILFSAIADPRVNIIAHPLRALSELNLEELSKEDIKKIIQIILLEQKKDHKIAIEINGGDLKRDVFKRKNVLEFYQECINNNIPISIGSDAHSLDEINRIPYDFIEKLGLKKENLIKL